MNMTGLKLTEDQDEKAKDAVNMANGILGKTISKFKFLGNKSKAKASAGKKSMADIANQNLKAESQPFQRKGSRKFGSFRKKKNTEPYEKQRKGSIKRKAE